MGFKDFFSSAGRGKARLARNTKTVINGFAQSADRYAAMEQLLEDGSKEAHTAVLRRFTVTSSKTIEDEEEKGWVYRRTIALEKGILPALKQFCATQSNLAWALRIVEDVANETEEWAILDAILAAHPPGYERDSQTKLQVLTHLQEIDDEKVVGIVSGYLDDEDETVRFHAVEALLDIGDEHCQRPLLDRFVHEKEDSLRLRNRVLDGMVDHGWSVKGRREEIAKHIGKAHAIKKGRIVRR
ncbi:MAG: HEAT repeat domain-containing protein [Nannocystaceae bacterium]